MNLLSIKCFATTSKGCPSFSYMARKNSGSMRIIMHMTDRLMLPVAFFIRKKTGTPISAAPPKQMSCRFVRLKNTLDLTLDKSLGTGIYAAKAVPSFLPDAPAFCGFYCRCVLIFPDYAWFLFEANELTAHSWQDFPS